MKKLFVIVMLFLLGACVLKPEKAVDMAVDFGSSNINNWIKFTGLPTTGRSQETIAAWVYFNVVNASAQRALVVSDNDDITYRGLAISFYGTGDNYWPVIEYSGRATTRGQWGPTGVPTISTWYFVVASYDNSDVGNDAVVYLNGVKQVNNLDINPTGVVEAITGWAYVKGTDTFNGKVADFKIYNRILTPAEVLDLYNSRCHIQNDAGLIFHAMLDGAAGLSTFDGATLAAGNTLVDRINSAIGVPSGNPLGYADNQLTCGGQ